MISICLRRMLAMQVSGGSLTGHASSSDFTILPAGWLDYFHVRLYLMARMLTVLPALSGIDCDRTPSCWIHAHQ
jgi:hypothetical protein